MRRVDLAASFQSTRSLVSRDELDAERRESFRRRTSLHRQARPVPGLHSGLVARRDEGIGIKNGVGLLRDPHRRDIAPAGELAGLPARDSPKPCRFEPFCVEAQIYAAKIAGMTGGRFISDG